MTELMKMYEAETGKEAIQRLVTQYGLVKYHSASYVEWLEARQTPPEYPRIIKEVLEALYFAWSAIPADKEWAGVWAKVTAPLQDVQYLVEHLSKREGQARSGVGNIKEC